MTTSAPVRGAPDEDALDEDATIFGEERDLGPGEQTEALTELLRDGHLALAGDLHRSRLARTAGVILA